MDQKDIKKKLEEIKKEATNEINSCSNFGQLLSLKTKYLGKKSNVSTMLKQIGKLPEAEKKVMGRYINEVSADLKKDFDSKIFNMKQKDLEEKMKKEKIDVTLPGKKPKIGKLHPLTKVLFEINNIFLCMGFSIASGPEIETGYYNFEALNIPKDHPARDDQDTFYISSLIPDMLLRTQTSPVQIHVMEKSSPPIKIISPGRVYRADDVDATHSPIFHQVEGLLVDKDISMANLKATLETFIAKLYGPDVKTRFRPHHFPFTEPSAEMDISCFKCGGKGCSLCGGEGYIEILGCGMVHEDVLKRCNIDPDVYSGFAFGLGLERIVMMRYGINDLRLFYENDVRFLNQF